MENKPSSGRRKGELTEADVLRSAVQLTKVYYDICNPRYSQSEEQVCKVCIRFHKSLKRELLQE